MKIYRHYCDHQQLLYRLLHQILSTSLSLQRVYVLFFILILSTLVPDKAQASGFNQHDSYSLYKKDKSKSQLSPYNSIKGDRLCQDLCPLLPFTAFFFVVIHANNFILTICGVYYGCLLPFNLHMRHIKYSLLWPLLSRRSPPTHYNGNSMRCLWVFLAKSFHLYDCINREIMLKRRTKKNYIELCFIHKKSSDEITTPTS